MGLFDFLKVEKRQNNFLRAVAPFSNANTGVNVDSDSALNFSAVWACVRVISEAIASLPVMVYKEESNGDQIKDKSHPVYQLVGMNPNKIMTCYTFMETLMANLLIRGNAYFIIERDQALRPIALHYKDPEDVTAKKVGEEVY